jgi:hypothetical protein
MKILGYPHNRSSHAVGEEGSAVPSSPDRPKLPVGLDKSRDGRDLIAQLPQLSQVDLVAVEAYERSHRDRPPVLDRLHYLQGREPVPGYDALATNEIVETLAHADATTLKAVREYERKRRGRHLVLDEAARALQAGRSAQVGSA